MQRLVDKAVDRLCTLRELGVNAIILLRDDRRLRVMSILAAIVLLVVAVGFYWTLFGGADTNSIGDTETAWRYLIVCSECGYRERCAEHPARRLEQRDGMLKCPQCGQFKAAWYRRGSQSLPPGGW